MSLHIHTATPPSRPARHAGIMRSERLESNQPPPLHGFAGTSNNVQLDGIMKLGVVVMALRAPGADAEPMLVMMQKQVLPACPPLTHLARGRYRFLSLMPWQSKAGSTFPPWPLSTVLDADAEPLGDGTPHFCMQACLPSC